MLLAGWQVLLGQETMPIATAISSEPVKEFWNLIRIIDTGERMGKGAYMSLNLNDDIAAGSNCLISSRKSDHGILGHTKTGKGSEGEDEMHDDDKMQVMNLVY